MLHRFGVRFGGVDIGIMVIPGQDELGSYRPSATRPQERRIESTHDGEYVIIRVAQHQHDGTTLSLPRDLIITTLYNSITLRDDLATIGGDHVDLPLGFRVSLMAWGTSVARQVGQQHDIQILEKLT